MRVDQMASVGHGWSMSQERAGDMFKAYQAGSQKLDYFVAAIALATFAYVAQQYKPRRIEVWFDLVEPLSLLCLLAAVYYGWARIEAVVEGDRQNFVALDANAKSVEAQKIVDTGMRRGEVLYIHDKSISTMEGVLALIAELQQKSGRATDRLVHWRTAGKQFYDRRNLTLYAAMVLLTVDRLLSPYYGSGVVSN